MRSLRRWAFEWQRLAGIGLLAFSLPLTAGGYSVSPVMVSLSAERPATTLRVSNTQSQPVTIQVSPYAWSQEKGEDQLTESTAIIAMPPVFTVAPGKTQSLRVGLRHATPTAGEQAFRLILKEIPQPGGRGLQLALNTSLPVFVKPTAVAAARLEWQVLHTQGNALVLRVDNRGNAHGKFNEWQLEAGGKSLADDRGLYYLLPGATREWPLPSQTVLAGVDAVDIVIRSGTRSSRARASVR